METNKFAIPIAIIIAGIFVGGAIYLSSSNVKKETVKLPTDTKSQQMRPVSTDDHILGNPDAKVILVEYSDPECPFCKNFHSTMHKVIEKYGTNGQVAWVYRHFPIDQLHSKARKEAEATECANELGGPNAFWKYLDTLYEITPSNNGLDPKELQNIAKTSGLDVTAFNKCLSSGKYADKVQKDYEDAIKAGGRGTPHTVAILKDGSTVPIEGAQPFESVAQTLDILLK
jgi:protein-disulfide isomerase